MEEGTKKTVLIVVAAGCLAAAGAIVLSGRARSGADLGAFKGRTMLMICANEECGHQFEMDKKQYFEYHRRNVDPVSLVAPGVVCPQCGEQSGFRGVKCEKCGETFFYGTVSGTYRDTCPECGFSREEQDRLGG
jgi:hypothetical protein